MFLKYFGFGFRVLEGNLEFLDELVCGIRIGVRPNVRTRVKSHIKACLITNTKLIDCVGLEHNDCNGFDESRECTGLIGSHGSEIFSEFETGSV